MTGQPVIVETITEDAVIRRPTLTLDVALYEQFLADSTLSEQDRRALLETLWAIVVGFVDLGFVVEPAATSADNPGGLGEEFASAGFTVAQSSSRLTNNYFEKAAAQTAPPDC